MDVRKHRERKASGYQADPDDAPDTLGTYITTESLWCSSDQVSSGLCERNYLKEKV